MNYYNEHDPTAAAWLRELIKRRLIPDGHVDERSILDIKPSDLDGYTQCHFFAGIGGWSEALRLADWPEDRPIWTGSCPCQPFSSAGHRTGLTDERHLWPAFHWLVEQCQPPVVVGEQVASGAALDWLDVVSTDLEALGYAVGAASVPACGIGSPHIRQRAWFIGRLADSSSARSRRNTGAVPGAEAEGSREWREAGYFVDELEPDGATGFWSDSDWIYCQDGKHRPIKPGAFPLVAGLPRGMVPSGDPSAAYAENTGEARSMRLRGYGNAIVPPLAAAFLTATLAKFAYHSDG